MIKENRRILRNAGKIDPGNIDEYIGTGGYQALQKALRISPEEVIELVSKSGLRGRGGAGFATGLKWKYTRASAGDQKYVICNADEGEPGTFKDRIIMEQDPHLFIEGLIISAYACGAEKGYIYIRGEYNKSIDLARKAIKSAGKAGFLGKHILGSPFSFDLEIRLGAGSYLCGEELTLIESLEGNRGNPRIKPPFPAEKGLFNKPTLVNNVETLANIPLILNHGSEWFREAGTEQSPGTKLFCVSGDVENPGCFEADMGVHLDEIINSLAGGIKNGGRFRTALLGGAAGTFVPQGLLHIPMDYDSLARENATLGSGAIIVLDEGRSIPDFLRSTLEFFKHESCGKCVPCRVGCDQLVRMAAQATLTEDVLDKMVHDAEYMARTSLCPLGQSPVLPLKSSVRYFRKELLATHD